MTAQEDFYHQEVIHNGLKNIARKINENNISANDTDEQFVVDFLKAAKEVTKFVDENNFEYGV